MPPFKHPATPQGAIAVPERAHTPVLRRYGGQRYPLPGEILPPVELNNTSCPPAAETRLPDLGNKQSDVGEAFKDPANGRVIQMIVMIMGDNHCIELLELFDRQSGRRSTLWSEER